MTLSASLRDGEPARLHTASEIRAAIERIRVLRDRLGAATKAALADIEPAAFAGQPWNQVHTRACKESARPWSVCCNQDCPARNGVSLEERLLAAIVADLDAAIANAKGGAS